MAALDTPNGVAISYTASPAASVDPSFQARPVGERTVLGKFRSGSASPCHPLRHYPGRSGRALWGRLHGTLHRRRHRVGDPVRGARHCRGRFLPVHLAARAGSARLLAPITTITAGASSPAGSCGMISANTPLVRPRRRRPAFPPLPERQAGVAATAPAPSYPAVPAPC